MEQDSAALWYVLGGLGTKALNQKVKAVLDDVIVSAIKTDPTVPVSKSLPQPPGPLSSMEDIQKHYQTWTVSSCSDMNQYLKLYLMTGMGFYALDLPSCTIAQALPAQTPKVCPQLMPHYIQMYQRCVTAQNMVSVDQITRLKKFQLNCFFNMLLKDLLVIVTQGRERHQPTIPAFLKAVLLVLNQTFPPNDTTSWENRVLQELQTMHDTARTEARQFLCAKAQCLENQLFFQDYTASVEATQVDCAVRLGMVFHAKFCEHFVVFLEPCSEEQKLLSERTLQTGLWMGQFRMRYSMLD